MNAISPQHYQKHPSGLECISVARDQTFCIGSALKYLWRAGHKGDRLEDLQKSRQYLVWAIENCDRIDSTHAVDRFLGWWMFGGDYDARDEDRIISRILREDLHEALADLADLIEDGDD